MSSHRSRPRIESPEEPMERISVFERLGRKRLNVPIGPSVRTNELINESDLRNKMSRKRGTGDVSPTRQSVSPVRHHSSSSKKLDDKLDTNSKVKSLVMTPNARPESPTSRRSGHSSNKWDDDIDSEELEQKRLELQKELQELEKTDKKNLNLTAVQTPVDIKITRNSSRSSSIISSESSSTLKSLAKTESSESSDKKVVKSDSVVKEEKPSKGIDIKRNEKSGKSHVLSSISLKSTPPSDEPIRAKSSELKFDRHGNIRISLDEIERQKRLRAERFGPVLEVPAKRIDDRKIETSRDRSYSPPSKKTKSSSRHHISDSLQIEKESRHKHSSTHSKYGQSSRSRDRSHSSKRDDTRSKADSDRSSRTGLDPKYRDSSRDRHYSDRDNTSVTSKKSRKRSDNYSRDQSPAHSSSSKLSHRRESSIGSDFSRRSKSERIDNLLMSSQNPNNSDVKASELKPIEDPIIEEMSPISADSSIPEIDIDSPKSQTKAKSEGSLTSKKEVIGSEAESDGNFSDWSEGEDELLLKTDGFETMDEICNISDNSLEKDTWIQKSSNKKSNGVMAHNKDDALEAISDDELDAIIGESDPIDSTSESRNASSSRQVLDALDIDWKSLVTETKPKFEFIPGSARKRFNPANVLMRIGFSQTLAGPELTHKLTEFCKEQLKEEFVPFRHPIASIHSFISDRIRERQQLFGTDSSQSTVLSGRKDLQIRKMLNKTNFKLFDNCLTKEPQTSSSASVVNDSLVSSTNPIETNVSDVECF